MEKWNAFALAVGLACAGAGAYASSPLLSTSLCVVGMILAGGGMLVHFVTP
jgi:hypothetical protein